MILKEEIENNIKYTIIKHSSNPTTEELIEALNIIHSSEYCKVFIYTSDTLPIYRDFIYYKNGRIHNEFGYAMHLGSYRFYGIDGEIEQTYKDFDKKYYEKLLRYKKLKKLKK